MAKKIVTSINNLPDPEKQNPQTAAEYSQRAWLFYSRSRFLEACSDMQRAVSLEPSLDFFYALGLFLRASGKNTEALAAFEQALTFFPLADYPQRSTMLLRLLHGQINMIKSGDWNLEREVWKRLR